MATKRISKSQFMMGRQCLKRLWLYNYRKDLRPPVDPAQQQIFDQGHAIGELAREYFVGGKLVDENYLHIPQALEHTAALIKDSAKIIYEATFVFNNVLVRCDILKRNRDGSWDLIEVKGSTQVKEEYLYDVAIQRYVVEGYGLKIKKAELMHIDNTFVKKGPIDAKELFAREDITEETAAITPEIKKDLKKFMKTLACVKEPGIGIGRQCSTPYECEFCGYCWKKIPEYSIYDIPRLSWDKKNTLKTMGILRFRDVPATFDLNDGQRLYLEVEKSGKPVIDNPALEEFVKSLEYPLYHIDFETIMLGIPLYDGTRPYQQLPFQISLHIQATPGSEPRHLEYLGDAKTDPRPELVRFMLGNIGPKGSLLAYNAAFEATRIKEMSGDFPTHKDALLSLTERLKDLMKPFKDRAYVHPKFQGQYSIKKVLPALIPDMTYEGLPIANGGDAQGAYFNMLSGKLSPAEMEKTRKDLKIYCGQDTLAMVKILGCLT